MKKLLIVFLFTFLLTACGGSDVVEIPDDAVVAICPQGDTFKYIYKDDVVYEFYSNDILQDDAMLQIVQNSVDATGTVREYLDGAFVEGVCTFSIYEAPKSE